MVQGEWMMYLIGIDLGTTGCKSIVFSFRGEILGQSYIEYGLVKTAAYQLEQDANLWWRLVKEVVTGSIRAAGVRADQIQAMGISSQGIAFVPVDAAGTTLAPAISWLDTRAQLQADRIRELFNESEVFATTGKRVNACYTLPKLMWYRENLPRIYQNTAQFLMGQDFLFFKFTGKTVTDYSMASGTMAFNLHTHEWDRELLQACGIEPHKLPQVKCMGKYTAAIQPQVAAELGLSPAVRIVLGAQDQKCAAIGAGIADGVATVSLGTATAISSVCRKPIIDRDGRIPCFCLEEDRWILESVVGTSGISWKWLKNTLFETMTYTEMDKLATDSNPGADGLFFYPHLEGATSPFWRNDLKGFLYGLTLSTGRADLSRAFLEGIAFQIRINLEIHERLNRQIREIRVYGGGSNSEFWCQLIANLTGKTVSVLYTSEIANLGAAVLAGIGTGVYPNCEAALSGIELIKRRFTPDQAATGRYQELYPAYRAIQEKLLL
jgi:xylulokinase